MTIEHMTIEHKFTWRFNNTLSKRNKNTLKSSENETQYTKACVIE